MAIQRIKFFALLIVYIGLAVFSRLLVSCGTESLFVAWAGLTLVALMGLVVLERCTSPVTSAETVPLLRNDGRRTISLPNLVPQGATPLQAIAKIPPAPVP